MLYSLRYYKIYENLDILSNIISTERKVKLMIRNKNAKLYCQVGQRTHEAAWIDEQTTYKRRWEFSNFVRSHTLLNILVFFETFDENQKKIVKLSD